MKTAKNSKNIIAKCAAALLIGLLVISGMGMKVYAMGVVEILTKEFNRGIEESIGEDQISVLQTNGAVESTLFGAYNDWSDTLSVGSLNSIQIEVAGEYNVYGIYNSGTGMIEIKKALYRVWTTASDGKAYGIFNYNSSGTVTITNSANPLSIKAVATNPENAYAVKNNGTVTLGETGKTVELTGKVSNSGTLNLAGTTKVTGDVTNDGTLNLNGQMTVSGNFTGTGAVVVDMSFVDAGNKPDKVYLIDCNGTATYGTYGFAEGKDNGYVLAVEGNDLVAKMEPQTLTFDSETLTKTYGDAAFTQAVKGAHTTVTYSSSDTSVATVDPSTGEVTIVKPGTTTIKASAAAGSGYKSAEKTYTLTVNAKELTVAGTAVNGKTYDGTTDGTVGTTGTLNGAVSGDDVSIDTSVATFDDKNAGNGHTVTVKYTLKGAAAGNYTVADSTTYADIDKKEVKVTADARSSYVGSELETLTYKYTESDLITGDSFTGALATAADKNKVGDYDITQGTLAVNDGNGGNNYTISYTKGTYSVKAKEVQTLTFAGITGGKLGKTYGDAAFKQTVTGAGTDVTYTSSKPEVAKVDAATGEVTILKAGTTVITAAAKEDAAHAAGSASYSLTVDKKQLTISGTKAADKEYDGNTSATITAGTLAGTVGNDKVTVTATGSFKKADAGEQEVSVVYTISGDDADNYIKPADETVKAKITAKHAAKTGDNTNMWLYVVMATAALAACIVTATTFKKARK